MKLAQTLVLILFVTGCHNQPTPQDRFQNSSSAAVNARSMDDRQVSDSSKGYMNSALHKAHLAFTQHRFSHKSEPFILTENNTADTVVAEFDYSHPEATGNSLEAQWLNHQIKLLLGFSPKLSFTEGQKKSIQDFLPEHPRYLQEKDTATGYSILFTDQRQITVEILHHPYLQFYIETAFFQGGPHIDYEKKYVVFDLKSHEKLKWQNLTRMPEDQLGALIEQHFRATYHLAPNAELTGTLPVHHLLPTSNFSITDEGIRFLYNFYPNPGENFPEVFIPYSDLKGTLDPVLKKRMGLDPSPRSIGNEDKAR